VKQSLIAELQSTLKFFLKSTETLSDSDGEFRPTPDSLSVAEQIAHTAQTIDWFADGMDRPEGFDLDFEMHWAQVKGFRSVTEARNWVARSFQRISEKVATMSEEDLARPLPAGPVMGGAPRAAVISAITDHTAHHRGALTVYTRLLGKVAPMPYM
jgi:uncharacterized damage-inducible protein DinB